MFPRLFLCCFGFWIIARSVTKAASNLPSFTSQVDLLTKAQSSPVSGCPSVSTCPSGDVFCVSGGTSCFCTNYPVSETYTWDSAFTQCQKLAQRYKFTYGRLVWFPDQANQKALYTWLHYMDQKSSEFWLGLKVPPESSELKWHYNPTIPGPVAYVTPNNLTSMNSDTPCVGVDAAGSWKYFNCNENKGMICELTCSEPLCSTLTSSEIIYSPEQSQNGEINGKFYPNEIVSTSCSNSSLVSTHKSVTCQTDGSWSPAPANIHCTERCQGQGSGWKQTATMCLKQIGYKDWMAGESSCSTQEPSGQAHLLTINNYDEYEEVRSFMNGKSDKVWLGYSDQLKEHNWVDRANESMCIELWPDSSWPNGHSNSGDDTLDCAVLDFGKTGQLDQGSLDDRVCTSTDTLVICQVRLQSPVSVASTVICDVDWTAAGSYCYKRVQENLTYDDAQAACKQINGRLPTFTCRKDYMAFRDQIWITNGRVTAWLGLTRDKDYHNDTWKYNWKWQPQNKRTLFHRFKGGEPNGVNTPEDCVAMQYDSTYSDAEWSDFKCWRTDTKTFCQGDSLQTTTLSTTTTTTTTTVTTTTSTAAGVPGNAGDPGIPGNAGDPGIPGNPGDYVIPEITTPTTSTSIAPVSLPVLPLQPCGPILVPPLTLVKYTPNPSQLSQNTTAMLTCAPGSEPKLSNTAIFNTTCLLNHTWLPAPTKFTGCKPIYPLSNTEKIVVMVFQTLGCTTLLSLVGATMAAFVVLHDISVERVIHGSEELALLCAHLLILFMRDKTEDTIPCQCVAAALQYFFLVVFTFMLLESLQCYAILTNIQNRGGYLNRKINVSLGWGIPFIYAGCCAAFLREDYPSTWSCWLNWGSNASFATIVPILGLSLGTVIVNEATGMFRIKIHPITDKDQCRAAMVNQTGLWFLLSAHLASWSLGFFAVYYVKTAMYATVSITNIVLGVCIFVFHCMGNPKANMLFRRLWNKVCRKNDSNDAPALPKKN